MSRTLRVELWAAAVALLVAMAAGSALILAFGESPGRVYAVLLANTWGSAYGVGQVLFKATPLIFTGLAVALAFRAGLFNIGGEGQMVIGGFATGLCGAALPAATPWPVACPLALAAGMAAGASWGAIPGLLKARFGAHEVINTIMLNFVASSVVLWLGRRFFFVAETTHTAPIVAGAGLAPLGLAGSAANASFFLALLGAALVWAFLARTKAGFEWRAVGASPAAAEAGGVRLGRTAVLALAASGALAGAVGANYVLGYKHYFEEDMGRGVGFMGIAVALLGRNHPVGVVLAALLFATLAHGGFAINQLVPKPLVEVLQAVIILAVVASAAELGRRGRTNGAGRKGASDSAEVGSRPLGEPTQGA
jgi:simple sugar transport system permease protein